MERDGMKLAHSGPVTCLAVDAVVVSGGQQLLVSGGHDCRVKVWNIYNDQLLSTLSGHTAEVLSGCIECLRFRLLIPMFPSVCQPVCLCVTQLWCSKTAEWKSCL